MNERELQLKELDFKIVKWWNDNAFLGVLIKKPKDIKNSFNEFNVECEKNKRNGFENIQDMIKYHQTQTMSKINYEKEIKMNGLVSSKFLDNYLGF